MKSNQDVIEREKQAERLSRARRLAGHERLQSVAEQYPNWNMDSYKAHECGRNGFNIATAKAYADAFGVNAQWLVLGIGEAADKS